MERQDSRATRRPGRGSSARALEFARVAQIPVAELHQMEVAERLTRLPLLRLLALAVRHALAGAKRAGTVPPPSGGPAGWGGHHSLLPQGKHLSWV
jgi:hypothetical protein